MEVENVVVRPSITFRTGNMKVKKEVFKKNSVLKAKQGVKQFLKDNFDKFSTGIQILCDFVIILLGFKLSYFIWEISPLTTQKYIQHPNTFSQLLIGIIFVLTLIYTRSYEKHASVVNIRELKNLVRGIILSMGILIILTFFVRNVQVGRTHIFYFTFLAMILIGIERYLFDKIYTFLSKKGLSAKKVLIFGAGTVGKRLAVSLEKYPRYGYLPVGFLDDKTDHPNVKVGNPLSILGTSDDLEYLVDKHEVDELILAIPSASSSRYEDLINRCNAISLPYKYVPRLHDIAIQKVRAEQIDGIPFFGTKHLQYSPVNSLVKRIFDIVFSIFSLVLLLPLLSIIAIAIKLDSFGPVFFRQKRVGKNGKLFTLYKYRTMYVNSPAYAYHPQNKQDPRITRMGRFLRRTSLDEIPQFFNVLLGDMSIVGPRPEMGFIVDDYNKLHRERLNVKPGITGLWQISMDRTLPIHENIDHDLFYIESQSFLLDIIIVFKTVFVALRGVGAR